MTKNEIRRLAIIIALGLLSIAVNLFSSPDRDEMCLSPEERP